MNGASSHKNKFPRNCSEFVILKKLKSENGSTMEILYLRFLSKAKKNVK